MEKLHRFSLLSFILSVVSIILFYVDYKIAAFFLAVIGIVIVGPDFFKYTSKWEFLASWAATLVFAGELSFAAHPLLGLSVLLGTASMALRFSFWEKIGYIEIFWLDPLLALSGLGLYIYSNINFGNGWEFWTVPGIFLGLTTLMALDGIKSGKYMLKKAGEGYAAEIGSIAPGFSLPDHNGNMVSLSEFRDKNNLLLIFVKGDWCPGCHMMLRCYEKNREKFKEKDIVVMAVGPDPVGINRDMVSRLDIEYRVLSDDKYEVVGKYGIQIKGYPGAPKEQEATPLPASFLIDKSGIVRYSSRPEKAGEFLNPGLIFPVLDGLRASAN